MSAMLCVVDHRAGAEAWWQEDRSDREEQEGIPGAHPQVAHREGRV